MIDIFSALLNILFPDSCLVCGKSATPLCSDCLSVLPRAWDNQPDMRACFEYNDVRTRLVIHKLKYKRWRRLASIVAVPLGEMILEDLSDEALFTDTNNTIIIPAPLSRERLRERGFNQALLLAEVASLITGIPIERNAVAKIKHTATQVSLKNRNKRLANPKGAFAITDPEKIKGMRIILIDDVYTTGATLNEIKRILTKTGAKEVIGFTLAH